MLSPKMEKALNEQITREMYSAFLYMSMAADSTVKGLKGFANWFMVQYHEEMLHAMKMYEYVLRQGNTVTLAAIDQPPSTFSSPMDMFTQTLAHEQKVTAWINELASLAVTEKDHATQTFMQWYVTEQVEEEENDNDVIAQLKLIGNDTSGLFMLDREMGTRLLTVPSDFSKGVEAAMKAMGKA
jgi:ferritin